MLYSLTCVDIISTDNVFAITPTIQVFKGKMASYSEWKSEQISLIRQGENNPFYGKKHDEATLEEMRENYSEERRERIGNLNLGKNLSSQTVEKMRAAALARGPMSSETRNKISANSTIATTMRIVSLDGNINAIVRTIPKAAELMKCGEKTVRRALKNNGMVKNTWMVTRLSD